jgi:hypothetical protein
MAEVVDLRNHAPLPDQYQTQAVGQRKGFYYRRILIDFFRLKR